MGEPLHQTVLVDIFDAAAAFTRVEERLIRCALTPTNPAGIWVDYSSGGGRGGCGCGNRSGSEGGLGTCIVAITITIAIAISISISISIFGAFPIYATASSNDIGISAAQVLR